MKKIIFFSILVLTLGITASAYYFSQTINSSLSVETLIDIPPRTSFGGILSILESKNIVIPKLAAKISARIMGLDRKIKAGEFVLNPPLSSLDIIRALTLGKSRSQSLLVKEGHSIWDIQSSWADLRSKNGYKESFDTESFQKLLRDPELLDKAKVPTQVPAEHRTIEGYLFPETYNFEKYDHPKTVLLTMIEEFNKRARSILAVHPWSKTNEGFYRLLTLASIVEKETGLSNEQPMVASVFWNRLKSKMPLQSDPTTIYGLMPNFDGNLKRVHLESYSAYNTYRIPELPVGPICNPGEKALRAVVDPAQSQYLYFVGKGDGTHAFANSYQEHSQNVRQYQLRR